MHRDLNVVHVDPSAKIPDSVSLGPGVSIGKNVEIGADTNIAAYAVIKDNTIIGKNNQIHSFVVLGSSPQKTGDDGSAGQLEIGDDNIFHEFSTVSTGSINGKTWIGNRCRFMHHAHVGHDCLVQDQVTLVNHATLAGHVNVGECATIGAFSAIHQFCNIGAYVFMSRACIVTQDVLPFLLMTHNPAQVRGLNKVGLTRNGFSKEDISVLQQAYRCVFREHNSQAELKIKLKFLQESCSKIALWITALEKAEHRGFTRNTLIADQPAV
jgi:UDP-N-acetylglucosamine acyltransferase